MSKLTQIIANDFKTVGQIVKGVGIGVVRGIYTPALMTTGVLQSLNECKNDKPGAESVAKNVTQFLTAILTQVPLAITLINEGKGKLYFGALAATNTVDYFVNAYKYSKRLGI